MNSDFSLTDVRKDIDLYSVLDAISFIGQKANASTEWKRMSKAHPDIVTNAIIHKFPGKKQKPTPAASKATIIEIITLLPGKIGGDTRRASVELLLQYIEAPEELAKAAIARITDKDKLKDVHEMAFRKYINHYHPLMGEIKVREGLSPTTYQHTNSLNTRACMGAEPKVIKAERGGKTAREHATSEELSRLAVLQELQCCGLRKADARGHSEISNVIQLAANDFQAMLERFGVV